MRSTLWQLCKEDASFFPRLDDLMCQSFIHLLNQSQVGELVQRRSSILEQSSEPMDGGHHCAQT
jgi:hypothetical protein